MLNKVRFSDFGHGNINFSCQETVKPLEDCLKKSITFEKFQPFLMRFVIGNNRCEKYFRVAPCIIVQIWSNEVELMANDIEIRKLDSELREPRDAFVLNLFTNDMMMWFLDPTPGILKGNYSKRVYYYQNIADEITDIFISDSELKLEFLVVDSLGAHHYMFIHHIFQSNVIENGDELQFKLSTEKHFCDEFNVNKISMKDDKIVVEFIKRHNNKEHVYVCTVSVASIVKNLNKKSE